MKYRFLTLLFALFLATNAWAQNNVIRGNVTDSETKEPIANVNITVVGQSLGCSTDSLGVFKLEVKSLPALLYFSHLGYTIDQKRATTQNASKLRIALFPEVQDIEEVTISAQRIQKVDFGDTLNVVDYEITQHGLVLLANPYKHHGNRSLYFRGFDGKPVSSLPVGRTGREIKFPEIMAPYQVHFLKDFMGAIHLLTRDKVWEIEISNETLKLVYPKSYPLFLDVIFPVKCRLGDSYYYQISSETMNKTVKVGMQKPEPEEVKTVIDKWGAHRYMKPRHPKFYKYVCAPIFTIDSTVCIFDFFGNNIEFFSEDGKSLRVVPMTFQNRRTRVYLWLYEQDLDQKNFPQKIFHDTVTNRFYTLYRMRVSGRQSLREIDMNTGE
ncbi:MAG: carboxypeptidase-like regulatory domain-containing protein, partial [Bacteroidales bacterium]|nr:carboxypeptidase-like regulatory domain-containing protein [Bacteroidales bacterium]